MRYALVRYAENLTHVAHWNARVSEHSGERAGKSRGSFLNPPCLLTKCRHDGLAAKEVLSCQRYNQETRDCRRRAMLMALGGSDDLAGSWEMVT